MIGTLSDKFFDLYVVRVAFQHPPCVFVLLVFMHISIKIFR